jgi:hypothetical protein
MKKTKKKKHFFEHKEAKTSELSTLEQNKQSAILTPAQNNIKLDIKFSYINKIIIYLLIIFFAINHVIIAASSNYIKDDMFITLRYSYNLYNFFDLNWNIGLENVDGYTSFFHTVLVAFAPIFGLDYLDFSIICNLLFSFLIFAAFSFLNREIFLNLYKQNVFIQKSCLYSIGTTIFGSLFLVIYKPLWFWQTGLLEALLFTLLITTSAAATLWSIRKKQFFARVAILFLALALCRPEGIALVLGLLLTLFVVDTKIMLLHQNIKKLIFYFMLPFVVYFIWHWLKYGYPFPNTYYAKLSSARWDEIVLGWGYIKRVFIFYGGFLCLIPMLLVLALWLMGRNERALILLAFMPLCYSALLVYSGGDVHQNARFWLPMVPFCLSYLVIIEFEILKYSKNEKLLKRLIHLFLIFLASILFIYSSWTQFYDFGNDWNPKFSERQYINPIKRWKQGWQNIMTKKWPLWRHRDTERIAIENLNNLLPSATSIACTDLGRLGYYAPDLIIYDLNALNDPRASHEVQQRNVIWGKASASWMIKNRRPDFILTGFPKISNLSSSGKTGEQIIKNNDLKTYFPGATSSGMFRLLPEDQKLYMPYGIKINDKFLNLLINIDKMEKIDDYINNIKYLNKENSSSEYIKINPSDMKVLSGFAKLTNESDLAMYSSGEIEIDNITIDNQINKINLISKGDLADNIGPHVKLIITNKITNEKQDLVDYRLENKDWESFDFRVNIIPGVYSLKLSYLNNSPIKNANEDRNFYFRALFLYYD